MCDVCYGEVASGMTVLDRVRVGMVVRKSHEAILEYWSKDDYEIGNLLDAVRSLGKSMLSKSAACEPCY